MQSSLVTYLNSGGKVGDRILAVCLSLSIPRNLTKRVLTFNARR